MNNTIKLGLVGIETETAPAYMAADFERELESCDPTETLYIDIHSEGGSVFEGYAMANALEAWPGKVVGRIKVAAFSIASYIAMKCDEIEMAKNGFYMIHNPYSASQGDDEALARDAKLLAEMKAELVEAYAKRTGIDASEIAALMKRETYIGSAKAIEMNLADRIIEPAKAKAQLPQNKVPKHVFAAMYVASEAEPAATPKPEEVVMSSDPTTPVAATVSAIKKAFPKANNDFVVKCMEDEMNMEDVGEEYAKAMEEENETLKAKVTAMEEELTALKAKAEEEKEDEKPVASGVAPVAMVSESLAANPLAKWNEAIRAERQAGKSSVQAAIAANRKHPGLREQVNAMANVK